MPTIIYILLGVIIAGLGLVVSLLYKKLEEKKPKEEGSLSQLNQNIQGLETRVSRSMSKIQESFSNRLDNTAKTVSELNRELGVVQQMNKQMKDLQSMIKSPKLRGNIGEKIMENLLQDLLPKENYSTQHTFRDGQIVDAIVRIRKEIIPIDSKFPIENFEKILQADRADEKKIYQKKFINDVRKHIRDISQKYIRPDEGTVNFAVMYIPSDSIFHYLSRSRKIDQYAQERKILVVSPNLFYSFLQTVIIGIERYQVSEKSQRILSNIKGIQRDAKEFEDKLRVLEKHITNAKKQMTTTKDNFSDMKTKIDTTSEIEPDTKQKTAKKPDSAEEESEVLIKRL